MTAQGVKSVAITNDGADLKSIGKGELTASQTEFLQEQVDEMGADFKAQVLSTRPNIDPEVFRAGWYSGDRAKALGLIDQIGTLTQ
jgi:ClpP class serine protease